MQIQHKDHNVKVGQMVAKREFTVRAGAHIMAILSGMYKNPKEAVVREYLSNMYDAYISLIKAGKTNLTPPILRLPVKLNPTIQFQDFGVGMDYETVWNVYAEYGNSTKSESNDEIGAFGIGSKTAFCYNNGAPWNITATKNGITNHFMAFVGKDGIPQLTHVGEERDERPNGVTISIPVRHQDAEEFQSLARKFIPYFPMELEVTGIADVLALKKRTYILEGNAGGLRWGITDGVEATASRYATQGRYTKLVMGNIPYVLDNENWNDSAGLSSDELRFFTYTDIDIFINIGDVDIVPSRDALKWTDRTKKAVGKILKAVYKDVPRAVSEKIVAAPTEWDAITLLQTFTDNLNINASMGSVQWRGKKLESPICVPLSEIKAAGITLNNVSCFSITNSDKASPEITTPTQFELRSAHRASRSGYYNNPTSSKPQTIIIVNDLRRPVAGLARGYIRSNYTSKTYGGRVARYGHTTCDIYTVETTASIAKLKVALHGFDHILKASTLKGTVAEVKGEAKTGLYRWNGKTSFDARVNIPSGEKVYYYVPVEKLANGRFGYSTKSYYRIHDTMHALLTACGVLKITLPTSKFGTTLVYGVKQEDIADLDTEWVNLSQLVKEKALKYIETKKVAIANFKANSDVDHVLKEFVKSAIPTDMPGHSAVVKDIESLGTIMTEYNVIQKNVTGFAKAMALETESQAIQGALSKIKADPNTLNINDRCKKIIAIREGFSVAYDIYRLGAARDLHAIKRIFNALDKLDTSC